MNPDDLVERLKVQGELLTHTLRAMSEEDMRVKPENEGWSIIEILGHLVDEEKEDFRVRLECVLDGARDWKSLDPERSVRERNHQEADPAKLLEEFEAERAKSLTWLASLGGVDWSVSHIHARLGTLRAGDLLTAWVAHDTLHHAQILRTSLEGLRATSEPYTTRYADS